jgi:hypothetical protein
MKIMNTATPELQSLGTRVEKLEKQNRRIKALCLSLVLLPMLAMVACQSRSSDVLDTQKIVLRDKGGKARIEIAMSYDVTPNGNPVIRLLDENGKQRTVIGAGVLSVSGAKQSGVVLLDDNLQFTNGNGDVTARLGSFGSNGGSLWLFAKEFGASILVNSETPVIELGDAKGFRADLGSNDLVNTRTGTQQKTSAASLVLVDKEGKVLWSAPH